MHAHEGKDRKIDSGRGLKAGNMIMRFGVSADIRLLSKFDSMIAEKGYANRSEAIRDLIRVQLVEFDWSKDKKDMVGTITLVYNHEVREVTEKLTELQHHNHANIISSLHVHLDGHNCLEVLVVKGTSEKIKAISDKLTGTKGVKHGKLSMSTTGKELY
jgi:CopG family nickel-responsive transcriptional regulator